MHDLVIRALEPDDLPGVTALFAQPGAVAGTLQIPFTSLERRRQRHLETSSDDTRLVATLEGQLVGVAGLHLEKSLRRRHAASIGIAVHDAFIGRGIGTALLRALLEQADRWLGLRRVELTVWADNARAIALYEHAGFEREGRLRDYAFRDGQYVDALQMARLRP